MNCSDDLGPIEMMNVPQQQHPTTTVLMGEGGARGAGGGSAELGRRLLLAARLGDMQAVLDLMAKGAPFTTDWLGTSALHVAAGNGHVQTCAVLLRAGVSRDCRTKVDRTPLHLAAHAGHGAVAELLLTNHAAVDCRDMLHMTPLHWAAERGHTAVARALLTHGADPLALSKFRKTPHALAVERKHHDLRLMMEDALKDREAAKSVESLRLANETEASAERQRTLESLDELPETAKHTSKQTSQPEPIKINIERPLEGSGSGSGGGSAAAAAMLRRHGITLLPTDSGSTVLSALQSGRSVVLSDAGKLMLKESSELPQIAKSSPLPAPAPAAPSKGVLLTATPVKSPPKQGVKIFTLNNKLLAMPKENKAPVKKIINPHDSTQIQYINVSSEAKLSGARSVPMKAKNKLTSLGGVAGGSPARPTVKLIMQKTQLNKLTDNALERSAAAAAQVAEVAEGTERGNVLFVPEEFLTNSSPGYLRTQLLSAHKTIASLTAQLSACKQRLNNYEKL